MSATALLSRLHAAGIALAVENGNLKLRGQGAPLGEATLAELRARKVEILALLTPPRAAMPSDDAEHVFEERAAILECDAGLPRKEAERIARAMVRQDRNVLASWQAKIEGMTAGGKLWDALRTASLSFLASPYVRDAIQFGWTEKELFGVFCGSAAAIPTRVDAQGLVSAIALAPFTYRLVALTATHAILQTEDGARLTGARELTGPTVPWWRHAAALPPLVETGKEAGKFDEAGKYDD